MKIISDRIKIFFNALVLLLWNVFIFLMSSIPGNGNQVSDLMITIERKGAHIFEYAMLAILWIRFFESLGNKIKINPLSLSIIASLSIAFLDELHQTFVFGRTGKPADIIIDLVGILLGLGVYEYFKKNRYKLFA